MESPDILNTLQDALKAHEAGDFANALKFYEHFFDHALDDDPYALYAVRFSHCLPGWGELASVFPGAKSRLERKRHEVLEAYLENRIPETFHDYLNICRTLGLNDEAVAQFLELQDKQPKSAAKLAKYIWDELIAAEHWQACSLLLEQPAQKVDELFSMFDESLRLREMDASFDNPQFDTHIVDTLINEVKNVVLVLRHSQRGNELAPVQRQFTQAVAQRNHALLDKQAHAQAAILFASH